MEHREDGEARKWNLNWAKSHHRITATGVNDVFSLKKKNALDVCDAFRLSHVGSSDIAK